MTIPEEFRIRRLILDEYRGGSSIEQACANINSRVSPVVISESKISFWYERFKFGIFCLFDENNHQYERIGSIRRVSNGKVVGNTKM
jgi:hypothetical protein